MKKFLKQVLVIFVIICTTLPSLFSNVSLADADDNLEQEYATNYLTPERAGNFVASFAINFFNNWSSDNHIFDDDGDPVKTSFDSSRTLRPGQDDNPPYVFSKKSWINFVYEQALSINQRNQIVSSYFNDNNQYFEKIDVADLESDALGIEDESEEESEEERGVSETTVELMNSGKIKPGDILITSEGDYLLYVGGTKIIYATPGETEGHPTDTGALKYDYIQNYFVEVRRKLEEGHEDDEDFQAEYGVSKIYRITKYALEENGWKITDADVNLFFNKRGYYDAENKYEGIPSKGSYDGSTHRSLIKFLIDGLVSLVKLLVNLALYLVRAVIVGWVSLFESIIQNFVLKLSGHSSQVSFVDKLYGVSSTSYAGERVTVESILFNKLPLTDANFFNFETAGGYAIVDENGNAISWLYNIRKNLALVYVIFRNFSIAAMLFVLLYIAIRMALSNIATRKAKYSQMLVSWFTGLCIIIFIHFFMYMVLYVNDILVNIFMGQNTAAAAEILGNGAESLTLYDAIRTKAYSWNFFDGLAGLIMYIVMVYYLLRFLGIYIKRMVSIYVLALFGSVVGVKYAIEKSSGGKSKNTLMKWMKDFIFNVLLQTIHCLIYVVFMSIAVKAALTSAGGIIVAILVFQFILKADGIFMKIFNIKGNLLDDTNKPPELRGMFKTIRSTITTAAIGWGVVKFGRKLLGENTGIRPLLRYSLNYRDGDAEDQTIARGESKLLNFKSAVAGIAYKDFGRPIKFMKNYEIQMRRRRLYDALKQTSNYKLKRSIYNTIQAEKKQRSQRFTRTLSLEKNAAVGTFGLFGSVGLMAEGFKPGILGLAASIEKLRGPAKDRKNVKLYRRLNPDKYIMNGVAGAVQIQNEKTEKDLKKVKDKQDALIRISDLEVTLNDRIEKLSQQTGMSHEEIKKELQNTITAVNKTTITGAKVRNAVNNCIAYDGGGKTKLKQEDLDAVIESLNEELEKTNSDIEIDDSMKERIMQALLDNGANLDGKDGEGLEEKDFAKLLTEAINSPDVVPVVPKGKIKDAANGVVSDKLARLIIEQYEKDTGITLTDDQKKELRKQIKGLPNIEEKSEKDAVDEVMRLMQGISLDEDKVRNATQTVISKGIPALGDRDFDRVITSVQKKINKKGISVELTSEIRDKVKGKIIEKQKARISGDATKTAEMNKLNNGQIISEDSNEEFISMVYEILSEPGMVPINSAADKEVQKTLQEAAIVMQQMKAINEANRAKNKESAVSYGEIIKEMLENF